MRDELLIPNLIIFLIMLFCFLVVLYYLVKVAVRNAIGDRLTQIKKQLDWINKKES